MRGVNRRRVECLGLGFTLWCFKCDKLRGSKDTTIAELGLNKDHRYHGFGDLPNSIMLAYVESPGRAPVGFRLCSWDFVAGLRGFEISTSGSVLPYLEVQGG